MSHGRSRRCQPLLSVLGMAERRQRPVWRPVTRHCSNCLRHTETDRVPEQRLNGYTIPAYTVCTYCGHSYGFEETA